MVGKIFSYMMLGSIVGMVLIVVLLIPLGMTGMTWKFWEEWTGGSEWIRSPGMMVGATWGFLVLACLGVR